MAYLQRIKVTTTVARNYVKFYIFSEYIFEFEFNEITELECRVFFFFFTKSVSKFTTVCELQCIPFGVSSVREGEGNVYACSWRTNRGIAFVNMVNSGPAYDNETRVTSVVPVISGLMPTV